MAGLNKHAGPVSHMGARFTAAGDSMRPILEELKSRGLMYVDSQASQYSRGPAMARGLQVPAVINSRPGFIDEDLSAVMISERLITLKNKPLEMDTPLASRGLIPSP